MSIITTIPSEFWTVTASALWWAAIAGVTFKGLSWVGHSFAAIIKADSIGRK